MTLNRIAAAGLVALVALPTGGCYTVASTYTAPAPVYAPPSPRPVVVEEQVYTSRAPRPVVLEEEYYERAPRRVVEERVYREPYPAQPVYAAGGYPAPQPAPGPGVNTTVGTIGGALIGGGIGSAFGRGGGKVAATLAGAAIGGILGNAIGSNLDEADRQRAAQAQFAAFDSGQPRRWSGDRGAYGEVIPGPVTRTSGSYCREYTHTIYIGGRPQEGHGTACREPDGSWRIVS